MEQILFLKDIKLSLKTLFYFSTSVPMPENILLYFVKSLL